ncbi:MAG: [protein-PII] uridylyltransferase [Stygiobacter sp.]|jgi:[protein-PII] uridylyltransferase|uniref:Bifunctional uridylyltransferase/uridylyl-removing enzyme n=1 Tax=Stygiobacter electus TaxID=3032292 RepID=A0AAE3TD80_9BACT|nr:[protein-PII] uridylyltransferase [Stygiobacter electus]MDF1612256.1 [protein-PII] uridylyltransferase [Stygiobacter electus]
MEPLELKKFFYEDRNKIFTNTELIKNPYQFCVQWSILVEEYILKILGGMKLTCAVASVGSFSRRELAPYSDIDLMFIFEKVKGNDDLIKECITKLWDAGIEVSHTVREFDDIEKFIKNDLETFTQFFDTRFLLGNEKIYNQWNKKILSSLNPTNKKRLLEEYIADIKKRYQKYGDSAKVLEPNVKYTAGGLRDVQVIQWMYCLKNETLLNVQDEVTQSETFFNLLRKNKLLIPRAVTRLYESFKIILNTRNLLHLLSEHKNDRLEFFMQEKIAITLGYTSENWQSYMRKYFEATNVVKRFCRTMRKRIEEEITPPVSDYLTIQLDDDFVIRDGNVSLAREINLDMSTILRAFYYRGLHSARFEENLRTQIIEKVFDLEENQIYDHKSSVFFREILKLPRNVGTILTLMNELGVLGAFLPEFKEMIGFFQPGVYHCYTADEHTIIAISNVEKLSEETSLLGKLFQGLKNRDLLYLALLFHDIAKPISVSGHEIIGAEIANTIMSRLGYSREEIEMVQFLVRYHLTIEQVAFRRNLNDPSTLDNFAQIFPTSEHLDLLYLVTYADLSAVSPVVWTQWKSDLLNELYHKTKTMLDERITAQELLSQNLQEILKNSVAYWEENVKEHIDSIDDIGYLQNFTAEEINQHIEEIEKGSNVAVFFKENESFTNITIITRDSDALLSKLCGALAINDLNIHDAKIYTRKDGIVIDNFNVTDFRTSSLVEKERYDKIKNDIELAINNELQIIKEFNNIKSKWWRIENKLFKRKGKVKIVFEKHDLYTIIDVYSPDRLGLLYHITKKLNELGLSIYFAKISTKADDIIDAFYILNKKKKKISSNQYELISHELTQTIEELLKV